MGESEVSGPSPLERMIALDGLIIGLVAGAIAAWHWGLTWVLAFVAAALVAAVARIIVWSQGDGRSSMACAVSGESTP